jgi:hypothetical protein
MKKLVLAVLLGSAPFAIAACGDDDLEDAAEDVEDAADDAADDVEDAVD